MDRRQIRAFEQFAAESGAELLRIATLLAPSDIVTTQDPHGIHTVIDTIVYLSTTWASAIPADSYGG